MEDKERLEHWKRIQHDNPTMNLDDQLQTFHFDTRLSWKDLAVLFARNMEGKEL
jgi:hypothetical protein